MLRILATIARNLGDGPATVRLPGATPVPEGYRGQVLLDPERCLACGVCAYVCVTEAVSGGECQGGYAWRYDPARCTFCARCVERCPGAALHMAPEPAPTYTRPGELATEHVIAFPSCPDCGAPVRPVTVELLRQAHGETDPEAARCARPCERCRRRRLARGLQPDGNPEAKERVR